jgi:hypothetical protein
MRRNSLERTTAALLALLVQVIVIAFFAISRRSGETHQAEAAGLIFIQSIHLPESGQRPTEDNNRANSARKPASAARARRGEPTQPAETNTAITLPTTVTPSVAAPPFDWRTAMKEAAQHIVQQNAERELHGEPLDSRPLALEMPARPTQGRLPPGTVLRLDNGDVLLQLDDGFYCIYSQPPLSVHFDQWSKAIPPRCSKKNTAEHISFDAIKPSHLRQPLPLPKAPQR